MGGPLICDTRDANQNGADFGPQVSLRQLFQRVVYFVVVIKIRPLGNPQLCGEPVSRQTVGERTTDAILKNDQFKIKATTSDFPLFFTSNIGYTGSPQSGFYS
ncbi:MAG: hypothetical protein WAU91_10310 [Desulfatitalea sp.]